MGGDDNGGFLRYKEILLKGNVEFLQALYFFNQNNWIQHDPVAYNVLDVFSKNTTGYLMKHMFDPIKLQGVAGIRAALKPRHNIILGGKDIHYLTFTFIAPL